MYCVARAFIPRGLSGKKNTKMDELKKHIQQKLNELDVDEPNGKGWAQIEKELFPSKQIVISFPVRWAVAACIVLLAGVGVFLFNQKSSDSVSIKAPKKEIKSVDDNLVQSNPSPKTSIDSLSVPVSKNIALSTQKEKTTSVASVAKRQLPNNNKSEQASLNEMKALENVENSFTQVINMEKARINTTPLTGEDPSYFRDFGRQINQMEYDEVVIKKEIKKHGITDGLLDRLINIYQQKLNVLKQLQKEIQKTNNRFKQGRNPEETPKLYFLNI